MSRRASLVLALSLLGSCRSDSVVTTVDPSVAVVNPQLWAGQSLQLLSNAFSDGRPVVVTVDDSVVPESAVARAGSDTVAVSGYWGLGWHTVEVRIDDRQVPPLTFEVHGFDTSGGWARMGTTIPVHLVGRPLAVGEGSSKFWVGTSQGLAILDALSPATPPVLVDSTVDVSCLWSIQPVPGGGVVTADRGCGTLRARRYGAATVDVDSGPSAQGWHQAVFGRPGVWLLLGRDSAGVAVRRTDGSWRWSYYGWSAQAMPESYADGVNPPGISPDGRLVVAGRLRSDWRTADLLAFDIQNGTLLFRRDSAPGPAVAFSPSGDTLIAFDGDTTLELLESLTGRRLAAFDYSIAGLNLQPWGPLVWDPYGPWLYAWVGNGCPALVVVDRRSWTLAGRFGWGQDIPECDGSIAVSGFTHQGWALTVWNQGYGPYYLASFSVPDP